MNLLYLISSSAIAQTITPITTESAASGIPWYAWAGLAAAVAAVAYVVLKKKDPAALTVVTAAGSNVVSDLTSLLHKAHDTISVQAATIAKQVGASPPTVVAPNPSAAAQAAFAAGMSKAKT